MKNKNITIKHSSDDLSNRKIPELDQALVWLVRFQLAYLTVQVFDSCVKICILCSLSGQLSDSGDVVGMLNNPVLVFNDQFVSSMCFRQISKQ